MKPSRRIEWIQNEPPVRFWRTADLMFVIGVAAIIVLEASVLWFLAIEDPTILVAYALIPFLIALIGVYAHVRFRTIWPPDIGLSDYGVHFRFSTGKERSVPWDQIREVKLIGPVFPSAFGLIKANIIRADGRWEVADICGEAAKTVKARFEGRATATT